MIEEVCAFYIEDGGKRGSVIVLKLISFVQLTRLGFLYGRILSCRYLEWLVLQHSTLFCLAHISIELGPS